MSGSDLYTGARIVSYEWVWKTAYARRWRRIMSATCRPYNARWQPAQAPDARKLRAIARIFKRLTGRPLAGG